MAEADPVGLGVREQAVEQQHRPALAQLVPGQLAPSARDEACALVGELANGLHPAVDQRLVIRRSRHLGQASVSSQARCMLSTPKCCVGRKRAGSSNLPTVRSIFSLSGKAKPSGVPHRGRTAAARSASCRYQSGSCSQRDVRLALLERDRDAAGRALAHPAMAQIGVVIGDLRGVADSAALAAAGHGVSSPGLQSSSMITRRLNAVPRVRNHSFLSAVTSGKFRVWASARKKQS